MPIKVYDANQRVKLINDALELRYQHRMKWEEIADKIDIARSTLSEWRKSDEWREADSRWRRLLRDRARGTSAEMLEEAVQTIYELMKTDRSGYVRFMSASKLIDMHQIGNEIEEELADQQKELNEFLLTMAKRKAAFELGEVRPGGMLPEHIEERNAEYRERKLRETQALEAEYRELDE